MTKRFGWLSVLPVGIGARLYLLAGIALLTVAVLGAASMHFVMRASETAIDIKHRVQTDIMRVNSFELLLERHRRIVETAPMEQDRARANLQLERARQLIGEMTAIAKQVGDDGFFNVAERISRLAVEGSLTLQLAADDAKAASIAHVPIYTHIARQIQSEIADYKGQQMDRIERDVVGLIASAAVLTRWVALGSVAALLLIGPFSLLVTRHIVRRLKGMTQTMLRLAANDTAVHVTGMRYPDELGDMARAVGVFKSNAIALLAKQSEIEMLNHRFEFALNNMSRGLSMFDREQRLIVCNERYRDLYRLPIELAQPGTAFADIMACRIANGTWRRGDGEPGPLQGLPFGNATLVRSAPDLSQRHEVIGHSHHLADGRTVQIAYQPLADGGWVALHADVTQERLQEERIEHLAHFDSVTGIANRYSFTEQIDRALANGTASCTFAVHWIDLDRFKDVNDTFGHPAGDALLQQVAARLTSTVRVGDLVARLGGDEFAVVQTNVASEADVHPLALRLINVLGEPYTIASHRIEIGASLGVVLAPADGGTAQELIRNADIALYQAKARGRGCHVLFAPALIAELQARRGLEADLLEALRNGGFEMHYQPILDLLSGEVIVCEALMRWTHPVRGSVSPAVFIPIAEEIGAICELGAFALRRACLDAAGWDPAIKVAVNLSAVQFGDGQLLQTVVAALAEAGLPGSRLELEITETVLMADDTATLQTLQQLREHGVTIALDDFGTGFSSLNYLRRFPFDKIKIDQSFIRDLPSRAECVAIVRAIAELAKTLGMQTVAEGVETADHLQRVAGAGCNAVQGYLISRPVAHEQLADAIAGVRGAMLRAA